MRRYRLHRKRSLFRTRAFAIFGLLFVALGISITSFYFTNKDFATELRQIRQPKPNVFYIGIDVSQTIRRDVLADFKDALISRLKKFIGEKEVYYHISVFGLPGCGEETFVEIVSARSPEDPVSFTQKVEKRIREISIARRAEGGEDRTPLTTPLLWFLEKALTETVGGRVIIFSDLVNDDSGCQKKYPFPLKAIERFGSQKEGQIIFLYPTPFTAGKYDTPDVRERLIKRQRSFMVEMQRLSMKGGVRAFFYHIPIYSEKRSNFFRSQLQNSIPATTFEIIWERVSKMVDTIIGAVRG
jgi:hypothetical protein